MSVNEEVFGFADQILNNGVKSSPISEEVFGFADQILNDGVKPLPKGVSAAADDILKQAGSQQVKMQRFAEKDLAAREGKFFGSPFMRTAVMKAGATGGGLLARLSGHEDAANRAHRLSEAYTRAHKELLRKQEFPVADPVARKTLEIGTEITAQAPFMGLAAFGGVPVIIGQAAVTSADRSYTQALDAGKSQGEAARHAIGIGVIEGGITTAFQLLGLGGVEKLLGRSAKPAMVAGVKEASKRLLVTTSHEMTEELSISLAQSLFEDHVTGVAPGGWERFKATAGDVALQTFFTSLAYSAPGEMSNAGRQKLIAGRGKILQIADEGRTPTRTEWKGLGFSRFSGLTQKARKEATDQMADQIKQTYLSRLRDPDDTAQLEIPSEYQESFGAEPLGPDQPMPSRSPEDLKAEALKNQPGMTFGAEETAPTAPVAQEAALETQTEPEAVPMPLESSVEPEAAPEAMPVNEEAPEEWTDLAGPSRRMTEALREDVGLAVMENETPEDRRSWVDAALANLKRNPDWTAKLFARLQANKKTQLSKIEVTGMGIHIRKLKNDVNVLRKRERSDDPAVAELASIEMSQAIEEINIVTEAVRGGLRENGRALSAAATVFTDDFSFATIAAREQAEKGSALTRDELARASRDADEIAKQAEKIARREEDSRNTSVATAVRDSRNRAGGKRPTRKRIQKEKKMRDALNVFKAVAFKGGKLADFMKDEGGAFNLDAIKAGLKVVDAALDLGATTFAEFWAEHTSEFEFDNARSLFKSAWGQAELAGRVARIAFRAENYAEIAKHAKKMLNATVDGGLTNPDLVMKEVHEEMQKVVSSMTLEQSIDAVTGEGNFRAGVRGRTAAQLAVADIKQQLKLTRELAAIEGGHVPVRTPSQKKADAKEIASLKAQIKTAKEKSANITEAKAKKAEQSKVEKLQQKLDRIQRGEFAAPRPRKKAEDSARVAELKAQITKAEEDSPSLQRMKAARKKKNYTESLERQLESYEQRLDADDIMPKITAATPHGTRIAELKSQLKSKKDEVHRRRKVWAKKNRTKTEKAFDALKDTLNTGRTLILSMDLPLMRQGATYVYRQAVAGKPGRVLKTLEGAAYAAKSDENLFVQSQEIKDRENFEQYERMGISFTDVATDIQHQEEMFAGGYLNALRRSGIPGVSHAAGAVIGMNRAHVSILNDIRADYADMFIDSLVRGGRESMTDVEAKIIGSTINSATGRGDLGALEKHAEAMVTFFLAPKYVASRFRLLLEVPARLVTGVGHTPETRAFVAKEVALTMSGAAAFLSLAAMAKMAFYPDEEPWPEMDPRSSLWGKIKIGNTTLDPMFGMSQALVFMTRFFSGEYKQHGSGDVKPLREPWFGEGEGPGFGAYSMKDVYWGFLASKLSPWFGSLLDAGAKEDVVGGDVNLIPGELSDFDGNLVAGNVVPIPGRDIMKGMFDLGIPAGLAASVLMWTGMGMSTYEKRSGGGSSAPTNPYETVE